LTGKHRSLNVEYEELSHFELLLIKHKMALYSQYDIIIII